MSDINRPDEFERESATPSRYFSPRPGRRVRIIREPIVSGYDALAFLAILAMVCMPLALGALAG